MHLRYLWLLSCALLAGCFDLETKTEVRGDLGLPAALRGEWRGTWTSGRDASTGNILLFLQDFEQQPVFKATIDNPCLPPDQYEFRFTPISIEIRHDDMPVLRGDLLGLERRIEGTYSCPGDFGTWHVDWTHDLPPVVDLTGIYEGFYDAPVVGTNTLRLELHQDVFQSQLRLIGNLQLGGIAGTWPIAEGVVEFRRDGATLFFKSEPATGVQLLGLGHGDLADLENLTGEFLLSGVPGMPPLPGTWQAARIFP